MFENNIIWGTNFKISKLKISEIRLEMMGFRCYAYLEINMFRKDLLRRLSFIKKGLGKSGCNSGTVTSCCLRASNYVISS